MKELGFLSIIIVGVVIISVIGIICSTCDNDKIDQYEPTAIQILATLEEVEARMLLLSKAIKTNYEKAGITRMLMEDAIQAWRQEVNNYNEAFPEEILKIEE